MERPRFVLSSVHGHFSCFHPLIPLQSGFCTPAPQTSLVQVSMIWSPNPARVLGPSLDQQQHLTAHHHLLPDPPPQGVSSHMVQDQLSTRGPSHAAGHPFCLHRPLPLFSVTSECLRAPGFSAWVATPSPSARPPLPSSSRCRDPIFMC